MQTKRDWYERNKERVRQYHHDRMKTHGEAYQQMLAKKREWYALNREKVLSKQRQTYHENTESVVKKKPGRKPKAVPTSESLDTSDHTN